MTRAIAMAIALGALVISLLIIADTRLVARADLPHDDTLFLRSAASIRAGDWLGDYDDKILSKGAGYPVVIAIADALSIPLKVVEQSLYLLSAGLMSLVVSRLSGRALLGAGVLGVLALDPTWFLDAHLRVLRETVYAAASLMVVGGIAWLFLVRAADPAPIRLRDVVAWLLLGITMAFFWLTREEGIWLVPAVAFLVLVGLLRIILVGRRSVSDGSSQGIPATTNQTRFGPLAGIALGVLAAGLGVSVAVGAVMALNASHYGLGLTNDLHEGAFPKALGALSRIQTGPEKRYVPVSTESRLAAYEVSPAAAELRDSLEAKVAAWGRIACSAAERSVFLRARGEEDALDCNEYYYGWFPWAVRAAALQAGHWDSGTEAQAFMERLAAELNEACDDGRLTCSSPHESLQPRLRFQHVIEAVGLIPDGLGILLDSPGPHGIHTSVGNDWDLVDIARSTHSMIAPPATMTAEALDAVRITGWVASGRGVPSLQVSPDGAGTVVSHVSSVVDGSVLEEAELPATTDPITSSAVRFVLETTCLADQCQVVIDDGSGRVSLVPVNSLGPSRLELQEDLVLRTLQASLIPNPGERALRSDAVPRSGTTVDVQRQLDRLYAMALPWLTLIGLIGVVAAVFEATVRRRDWALIVLATACAIAVLSRIGMFALLEVSAWAGALRISYLAPASPFLLTFAVLGTYLLARVLGELLRRRRAVSEAQAN